MAKLITDRDMREAVTAALGTYVTDFDVEAIVDEIHRVHGLIDIEEMDTAEFWQIVEHHDLVNRKPSQARLPCGTAWVAEIALCPRCGKDALAHADANARRTDVY